MHFEKRLRGLLREAYLLSSTQCKTRHILVILHVNILGRNYFFWPYGKNIFGLMVKNLTFRFSIYSAFWIQPNGSARLVFESQVVAKAYIDRVRLNHQT